MTPVTPSAPAPMDERLPAAPWPSPSDFPAFARAANAVPLLGADEEQRLLEAVQERHDRAAAWSIVAAHLRLVVTSVRRHRGYGIPAGDLVQEGTIGLMKALRGFRAALGVRFAAYAAPWVDAEIREYLFRNARIVRLSGTRALRRLFFGYRRTRAALEAAGAERASHVTDADIAKTMGVPETDVRTALGYFAGHDVPLDAPAAGTDDDERTLSDRMPTAIEDDPSSQHETRSDQVVMGGALRAAMASLPERDRIILQARRIASPPVSLSDLGQCLNLSAERVRQIEQRALLRLRAHMVSAHPEWVVAPRRLPPPVTAS